MFESGIIAGVAILAIVVIVGLFIASRYKVAKPTQAFVVTGSGGKRSKDEQDVPGGKVRMGEGVFVWPFIQQLQIISLESQQVPIEVNSVPSHDGIQLNVAGVATIKVAGNDPSIRAAAQRFGEDHQRIALQATENLSGALRSIVGSMDVKDILSDRKAFADRVTENVQDVVNQQGLQIDNFTIKDIVSISDYINNLERPKAAATRREALIAESNAERQAQEQALVNELAISDASRDVDLRKAKNKATVDQQNAQAEAARPLEDQRQLQIRLEQERIAEEKNAQLAEEKLNTTVKKQADADRYAAETRADAELYAAQKAADAELAAATAEASATELRGNAEAAAQSAIIREKGKAEAESKNLLNESYKSYTNAAALEARINALPKLAEPIAAAMANIGNMTVVSADGSGKIVDEMINAVASIPVVMKTLMGDNESALDNAHDFDKENRERKESEAGASAGPVAAIAGAVRDAVVPKSDSASSEG